MIRTNLMQYREFRTKEIGDLERRCGQWCQKRQINRVNTGKNCINQCSRCVNRGSCDKVLGCPTCDKPGWTGPNCDVDLNECLNTTHYCGNHSQCHNTNGSYSCTCLPWHRRLLDHCVCKCLIYFPRLEKEEELVNRYRCLYEVVNILWCKFLRIFFG